LNKIDLLEDKAWLSWLKEKFSDSVCISAKTGQNLGELLKEIDSFIEPKLTKVLLSVPLNKMSIIGFLYRQGKVIKAEYGEERVKVEVNIAKNLLDNLLINKEVKVIN